MRRLNIKNGRARHESLWTRWEEENSYQKGSILTRKLFQISCATPWKRPKPDTIHLFNAKWQRKFHLLSVDHPEGNTVLVTDFTENFTCMVLTRWSSIGSLCQVSRYQGAVSIRKTVLLGMVIPMLKIRRPNGRLIFNMEIAIRR